MKKIQKGGAGSWRKRDLARDAEKRGWEYVDYSKEFSEKSDKELADIIDEAEGSASVGLVAEAVPAGQLSFKRWTKKSLAGKLEPLASLPAGINEDGLVAELVNVAGRYLPADKIHIDETCNELLPNRSRVKWSNLDNQPKELEVYYCIKAERLPVLAHEVGHLETLPALGGASFYQSNEFNLYHAEVSASRWAVAFLKSHGVNGKVYVEAVNRLQSYLDGYFKELGVPVRYVLDENVENKKQKREGR